MTDLVVGIMSTVLEAQGCPLQVVTDVFVDHYGVFDDLNVGDVDIASNDSMIHVVRSVCNFFFSSLGHCHYICKLQ